MARTPEGVVKDDIKAWLDAHGFWRAGTDKPNMDLRGWYYMPVPGGMGVSGIPDFMGSVIRLPNWTPAPFGIEAKAKNGRLSGPQEDRIEEMKAAGWYVLVVDDVSQLAQLKRYMDGA